MLKKRAQLTIEITHLVSNNFRPKTFFGLFQGSEPLGGLEPFGGSEPKLVAAYPQPPWTLFPCMNTISITLQLSHRLTNLSGLVVSVSALSLEGWGSIPCPGHTKD